MSVKRVSATELERIVNPLMGALADRFIRRHGSHMVLVMRDGSTLDVGPPHEVLYEPPLKVRYRWVVAQPPKNIISLMFDNAARPVHVPWVQREKGQLVFTWINELTICGDL